MEFPAKLKAARTLRRFSQGELGKLIGLHQTRIAKWEAGEGEPSLTQSHRLAKALNVPLDYLADDAVEALPTAAAAALTDAQKIALKLIDQIGMEEALRVLYAMRDEPEGKPGERQVYFPGGEPGAGQGKWGAG